ncbi:MAG: hypothetical protein COW16_12730 [Sphingomonadales bacterium CG12_big_fil_rev_8_21_14_0_65_65_10]|nr:MAG: hypothetical protein COW16_12730 [Sphingomonadales bacterium CG12_big_fil_rev_8_21_14_0_65_65_10]
MVGAAGSEVGISVGPIASGCDVGSPGVPGARSVVTGRFAGSVGRLAAVVWRDVGIDWTTGDCGEGVGVAVALGCDMGVLRAAGVARCVGTGIGRAAGRSGSCGP